MAAGTELDGVPVGGLSGITYDSQRDVFYVVADDPSNLGPARFFTMRLELDRAKVDSSSLRILNVTLLRDEAGNTYQKDTIDPEGIAYTGDSVFVSSEGQASLGVAPFVREFKLDGTLRRDLPVPEHFRPDTARAWGVRHNLAFESLTLSPDGRFLFAATENALAQDGPESSLGNSSPARLLKFDVQTGTLLAEYVYWVEPVAEPTNRPEGIEVSGLVDLLAIDDSTLLALERSFSMGAGHTVRLFEISIGSADDVSSRDRLAGVSRAEIRAADKELLMDLANLQIHLDNVEGMTLGPLLSDGRQSLVLVADDNFNPPIQVTQVLAFALSPEPVDISKIQGAAHRSPLEGHWTRDIQGLVTAIESEKEDRFWIESSSAGDDQVVSQGLRIDGCPAAFRPRIGSAVSITGRVQEQGHQIQLLTTSLAATRCVELSAGHPLSSPLRVGRAGRRIPAEVIEDDGFTQFEPDADGIDFWESLEGMRVRIEAPRVVGPTNRFGDLVVVADKGADATGSTSRGGLRLRPGDGNPERLALDLTWLDSSPSANTGDQFEGAIEGILDYQFGMYRLRVQSPLPPLRGTTFEPESTQLKSGPKSLTVATFNVLNLSAVSSQAHFDALATTLADRLGSPDLIALQEIQDDTGPIDDGVVSAVETLGRLIDAILATGGARYDFRQINPVDNQDGGRPGSNIRVALLYRPDRVEVSARGVESGARDVEIMSGEKGPFLQPGFGRVRPTAASFSEDERRGFGASRKPLAAEIHFAGRTLFIINNHWSSKGTDTRLFGAFQPPRFVSEHQRSQQARAVARFVDELLRLDSEAHIIVLGDLNEHEYRTPLKVLAGNRLVNLIDQVPSDERYTFNFYGNSQVLDHVLVSRGLLRSVVARVDIVHGNADSAVGLQSSDHDPIVVELDFGRQD